MKSRIVPTACGVLAFAGLVGLFGYSLNVAPQAAVTPGWQEEKTALVKNHNREITEFTVSLDAANSRAEAEAAARKAADAKATAACTRLAAAGINLRECAK